MDEPAFQKPKLANSKGITYLAPPFTSVLIWIDPGTNWYGPQSGKRGRSQTFSEIAIQFCVTIAWLSGAPLRRAIEAVKSVLRAASLDWRVPDYSTLSRRNKEVVASLPREVIRRKQPLHLLLDNYGISVVMFSDGTGKNIFIPRQNPWRKVVFTI
jgi:hypothetical protein